MPGFRFKNFTPDGDLNAYANAVLHRAVEQAPYESSCIADVELRNSVFEATIELFARGMHAVANGQGSDCRQAIAQASLILEDALANWRRERFAA